MEKTPTQIQQDLLRPMFHSSPRYWIAVGLATALLLAGVCTFLYQVYTGIGIWGLDSPVFWAFDITNFVFWIGISHAGTLISAILRLANATWRRPVTRCAEAITVFCVLIAAIIPVCHIGRPWLAYYLIPYPSERHIWPNFRSPLLWDFFAILTYLTGSTTFLLLPMLPDFAAVRDAASGLRKKIYGVLCLGWQGTPKQWHRLETAMHIMSIVIVPVAVSVHTIVSWDFAMTPVPMWRSTIFGPYFVVGAIFSGIAALILAMALLRKFLHLEEYLQPIHFQNLGKLLLTMSALWFYFTFCERLTTWYAQPALGNGRLLVQHPPEFRTALLDHGFLQLHHPGAPSGHQEVAHHHRLLHRLRDHRRRHVDRALLDHRPGARTQISAVLLWPLPSDLG